MSMSQEEIEALMNGLDFEEEKKEEVEEEKKEEVSENEKPVEKIVEETENKTEEIDKDIQTSEDEINDLISESQGITNEDESLNNKLDEDFVDDILNNIEETGSSLNLETKNNETNNNIEDVLSEIEQIEETPIKKEEPAKTPKEEISKSSYEDENDIDSKIDNGVFPLPVDRDTKVVNQLSEVANDSEEKATKIFDVLSNILDYNNEIQNDVQELTKFSEKQTAMLDSLNQKFPNINAFKENLDQAKKMDNFINDINEKLNNGNMEIFQAMELMQYHDINRQKIERVMSVIRKLTVYLNNLFEDDNEYKEIAVAKHIHGDSSKGDLVAEDDLDALIAEFNK